MSSPRAWVSWWFLNEPHQRELYKTTVHYGPYMTTCLTWKMGDLPIVLIWKRGTISLRYEGFPAPKNVLACKIYGDRLALVCLFESFIHLKKFATVYLKIWHIEALNARFLTYWWSLVLWIFKIRQDARKMEEIGRKGELGRDPSKLELSLLNMEGCQVCYGHPLRFFSVLKY